MVAAQRGDHGGPAADERRQDSGQRPVDLVDQRLELVGQDDQPGSRIDLTQRPDDGAGGGVRMLAQQGCERVGPRLLPVGQFGQRARCPGAAVEPVGQ